MITKEDNKKLVQQFKELEEDVKNEVITSQKNIVRKIRSLKGGVFNSFMKANKLEIKNFMSITPYLMEGGDNIDDFEEWIDSDNFKKRLIERLKDKYDIKITMR